MEMSQSSVAVATEAVVVLEPVLETKKGREAQAREGGRMVVKWRDLIFAVIVPPCGVSRVRRLLSPPCNMRRGVVWGNAQATQAIPEILVQIQIQLVHMFVGRAVTGKD